MEKKSRRRLLDDKRIVLVISFTLAFLGWILVAGFINPGETVTIPNVKIDYQRRADDYKKHDLQIVTNLNNIAYADVMVSGDGSLISGFTNTDVSVYADYSAVTSPGTHVIPLKTEKNTSGSFTIVDWTVKNGEHSFRKSPTTMVTLNFEEVESRQYQVVVQAGDITAAPGYFRDTPILSQTDVTVSGPASEVAKVASVAAVITEDEERLDTKIFTVPLTLLGADGNEIVSEQLSVEPMDTVEVTIPVLEIRDVGLDVGIIGVPSGFDSAWFDSLISLSTDSIQVIGSSQAFANLSNPYTIAEIDISEMGVGWESEPITVQLPEGLRSQTPSQQVVARFNATGLVEKTFRVTDLRVVNAPTTLAVSPITDGLSVTLVGPQEMLDTLLPENIVVEVDAFNLATAKGGQQALPARVLVPSKNRVFASGQYTVVCDIGTLQ